ncbi:two-partner secretion domain-containing protein [Pseudomonas sp. GT1P32]
MDVRQYAFLARQSSAVVKTREHFWGLPKRGVAFLLANVMFWQPLWAQADGIVVANPGTALDHAGNGVQIVNIATPNGSGLSHNQFHDYNVSAQGLILNNGSAQTSLTQLGGIIIGNPNLKNSGSAQTILNEVIGGSPSQLRGYTEVAGQSAHVIVANPYGVTCNGCGFINTPRVTLTTGKPVLDGAGRVDHFQVDQGSIAIEGAGLNASNIDQFDLITRSATINANLYAKKLNVITGRNNVDATSLSVKALAADGSTAPTLAIDSSALGGMYAGAIKLVGTEQGVGVKLSGEMATSAGDLNLDANGKLTLATTGASGTLTVKAQSVQADGPLYAGGNLNVTASEDLFNQKSIAAGGNVMLASNGQLTNLGIIEAGINADNTHNLTGDVQIDAKNLRNAGQVIAAHQLTANVEKDFDNRKGLMSANAAVTKVTVGERLDNTEGTLQAKTDLVVSGATVINQNGAMLGKAVTVTATHLDNSQQGRVVADSGALTVTVDQAVNNQQGRLQATDGDVALKAGSVDNRAGVVVGKKVAVTTTSGNLDNRAGQVLGNRLEVDAKTAVDNRDSGQLLAGSDGLKLKAKGLQNQQGNITAGGSHAELDLSQGRLDNQSGTLSASSVSLTAGDVDNSGGSLVSLAGNLQLTVDRLVNQGGLIEASQKLQLDGQSLDNSAGGRLLAHFGDLSRIALQNELDNRGGHIAIGSDNFVLQAGTLRNGAGQIEHAATGQFSVNSASLFSAQGRLVGLGSGDWNITNVDGIGLWHVNGALDISGLQSIALQAGDRIASASSLSLDAVSLSNAGELLSDGDLTLKLSGNLTNQGLISTQQALKIKAANVTQNGGRIASASNGELVLSGTLDNLGRLTSSANLSVVADRIDNGGTLGAQQLLTLSATRDINNRADSLIFSGADMTLRADSLLNRYADFYSKGKLSFAALDGSKASQLINRSGSIESGSDIDIKVRELTNEKAEFEATQSIASRRIVINCTDCSGGTHSGYYIVRTLYEGSILKDSPASRLLANQDLLLDAVTVTNGQSLLAANRHTTITASNFYNRGFTLDNREENINYFLGGVSKSTYRVTEAATNAWNASYAGQPLANQAPIPIEVTKYPIENITNTIMPGNNTTHVGTVQAGGTLKLNVSGELVNGSLTNQGNAQLIGATLDSQAIGAGGQQIILASPVGSPGPLKDVKRIETVAVDGSVKVSFVPVDFTGAAFVGIDPTSLPSFRLPQGDYGLFTQSRNPANKYLIETNPSLVDLSKFMSSDYLIGKLGYDPDQAARRLGDGRYETRLIADAVRAQTGQRFLADGLSSDYEQFQYLMDNAISSKNALNLNVGVMLTSQQVAALTHDIVWMEERVVNGETVLVPVLYLAKVDSRNLRGGSLIQGRNVEMITGGDLKNVGTLRASEDLSALSGGSILQGGLAQANANLTLLAQDSIRNAMAGEIRADKVNLTSLKGDIVNDRTATTFNIGAGSATQVDAGSSISAGSKLTINAANNLTSKGRISSGGDATLTAGNDINLLAVEDRTVTRDALRRGMRTEETLTQLGSSVTAAGNLTLHAGRDLNSVASKASAGKDLNASADGDINLISAEDEHNLESRYKKGNKKVHEIDDQTRQVASEFSAGGNLSVKAAGDVTLRASNLTAGNEAYVYAGNNLNVLAAENRDYTLYDMKKKGSWGSKATRRDEVTDVKNIGSQITSGGNLTLESGGDQLYQVAKLESGKDITLDSGGSITFEAVKDLHDESHIKSSNNLAWTSAKGKGNTDETLRQSQLVAQGRLVIKAVEGLKIDIKQVDQQSVSQTIDAMVKADPQLAWLKEAEKRGDVDWQLIKETHESFKYSNSSLGQGAMLAIIIIVTVLTAGAASTAVASASTAMGASAGGTMAAASAATAATATAAATSATAAGLGNVIATGVLTSMASTAAVSTINNKGNLGAAVKDVFSSENLKGYVLAGATAGIASQFGFVPTELSFDSAGVKAVAIKIAADTAARTAIMGGSLADNLLEATLSTGIAIGGALAANKIGDVTLFENGKLTKVAMHAALGGLMAEAMGGDFRTGALAAGANEAVVEFLADKLLPVGVDRDSPEYLQGVSKLLAASQLIGVLSAAITGGDASAAAAVTANATQYNNLDHPSAERLLKELQGCRATKGCSAANIREIVGQYEKLSTQRSMAMNACGNRACVEDIQKSAVSLDTPVAKDLMDFLRRNISYDMPGLLTGNPGLIAVPSEGVDPWGAMFTSDKQMAFAKYVKEGWLTPDERAGIDQWVKDTSWLDQQAGRQLSLQDRANMMTGLTSAAAMALIGRNPAGAGAAGGAKEIGTIGGQAASTLSKNFGESVLGHNTQIGVRNSKAGTISGAHNHDAFLESVEITGAKISNKITDVRYPGLVEYSYQLPRTNTKGELMGGYKPTSTKTTYDPKVLPDSKVADMSSRAAIQAESLFKANPALREASIKVDGYHFQVTRNSKTGEITNSFITMPPRTN